MTPVTAAKVKYGVWGLIYGAVIAMIVGFVWGGVDHQWHDQKAGRRGGLGGAGGDLRRAIHETTDPCATARHRHVPYWSCGGVPRLSAGR